MCVSGEITPATIRRSPLGVLQRRLLLLRVAQRERARANLLVELVLDPVDLGRPRVRLGPEVPRIRRMAAELEADQVILLVRRERTRLVVGAHLPPLEPAGVLDGRADRARPAAPADRRVDRR